MFKVLFDVLFGVIIAIVNVIMIPIQALVENFVPEIGDFISKFYGVLNNVIGGGFSFFYHLLPPTSRTLLVVYLTFLISFYTISISAHAILKVYTIIKRIKVW